eukprot:UN33491
MKSMKSLATSKDLQPTLDIDAQVDECQVVERVALVILNWKYKSRIEKPKYYAELATVLTDIGFKVVQSLNQTKEKFVNDFLPVLQSIQGGPVLLFYSGYIAGDPGLLQIVTKDSRIVDLTSCLDSNSLEKICVLDVYRYEKRTSIIYKRMIDKKTYAKIDSYTRRNLVLYADNIEAKGKG